MTTSGRTRSGGGPFYSLGEAVASPRCGDTVMGRAGCLVSEGVLHVLARARACPDLPGVLCAWTTTGACVAAWTRIRPRERAAVRCVGIILNVQPVM